MPAILHHETGRAGHLRADKADAWASVAGCRTFLPLFNRAIKPAFRHARSTNNQPWIRHTDHLVSAGWHPLKHLAETTLSRNKSSRMWTASRQVLPSGELFLFGLAEWPNFQSVPHL